MTVQDRQVLEELEAEVPGVLEWARASDRAPLPAVAVAR